MQHTLVCAIEKMARLINTAKGNPKWRVHTDSGVFQTKTDAAVANTLSQSWEGKRVELSFEGSEIIGVKEVDAPKYKGQVDFIPFKDEPPWLSALVDQRMSQLHPVLPNLGPIGIDMALTSLRGMPESIKDIDIWERTCDHCGAYTPPGDLFYTGHVIRQKDGLDVMLVFGVCLKHRF